MKGDTIVFNGIRDVNSTVQFDAIGIFSLNDCKGNIDNAENRRGGDSVFTSDRAFSSGLKQESELNILSNKGDSIKSSVGDFLWSTDH